MLALAVGIGLRVGGIEIAGNEAAVLPFVDEAGELACGPAFLVEPFGLDQLLENAELVVGIEDGEIALQADQFGVAAEHLRRDAVKGAEPGHALDRVADHAPDALAHFARRLVGEGHRENFGRSEEHTSELQSLMRISYAVFCLKKKKDNECNL